MDYSPTFLYGNNKHQFWPDLDNHIRKGISIIDYDLFNNPPRLSTLGTLDKT